MSQVVHGTAPAATGDGRRGRVMGWGAHRSRRRKERLDRAPNTRGALDLERHREESASSVGDVSRKKTASFLFAETRATSSNNAPSRFARNVGERYTT